MPEAHRPLKITRGGAGTVALHSAPTSQATRRQAKSHRHVQMPQKHIPPVPVRTWGRGPERFKGAQRAKDSPNPSHRACIRNLSVLYLRPPSCRSLGLCKREVGSRMGIVFRLQRRTSPILANP